jgi:hypothetical protein
MNESAEEIGMERTLFYNPSGLDNEKGNNLSTAKDLSKLVKKVLEIPLFREILKKDHYQLSSKNSSVHYTSRTTNKFINGSYFEIRPDWYERIVAGKTGFTYSAGGCLVIVLEDENKDGYIINIIFGFGMLLIIIGGFLLFKEDSDSSNMMIDVHYNNEKLSLDYRQPGGELKNEIEFVKIDIPEGVSSFRVASILESAGLIDANEFLNLIKYFEIEKRIKAGNYTFNKNDNIMDILSRILLKKEVKI